MRLILVAGALALTSLSAAQAKAPSAIRVSGAWTRPVAAGQMAAGYLTLTNSGKQADRLISVTSPAARSVTLHQSIMRGDIASMVQVKGGLKLAAGQTVAFEPGGYHLMIAGVKADQKLGGGLPLTLTFAHAGAVRVSLKVTDAAPN